MAKKKGEVQPIHPSDSGSDSDEQITDSEPEHESEPQPPKPSTQISNSSDSDDSGSDSDSEDEESEPEPQPEPVAKKSKLVSEVNGKGSAVGVKRGAEKAVESKDVKKPKKVETLVEKDGKSEDGVSKKMFQRVFSEDDEIVLLKGMLDFTAKEKADPVVQIDEFVDFIKKLLHSDVTKQQLLSKIKRLKGKYVGKVNQGHKRKFSKQCDREVYELSNKIWGNVDVENINNVDGGLENGKEHGSVMIKPMLAVKGVNGDVKFNGVDIGSSGLRDGVGGLYAYAALEQRIMSEEIENIGSEKTRELEKKLTKIEVAELELCVMRWDYMAEKAKLVVAAKNAEL